jgi:carbamoylphosphate synthase large subunit
MVAANKIGYPILIELPLLLLGWVRAGNDEELKDMALKAFRRNTQIFDRPRLTWLEGTRGILVVRDSSDNCVTVCLYGEL